jgi:hypothetical protein
MARKVGERQQRHPTPLVVGKVGEATLRLQYSVTSLFVYIHFDIEEIYN